MTSHYPFSSLLEIREAFITRIGKIGVIKNFFHVYKEIHSYHKRDVAREHSSVPSFLLGEN